MYYIWNLIGEEMKKLIIPMMIVAILVAFFEQVSADKNVYITVVAIAIFMFGMMRLSAKTPSKNQDNQDKEEKDV
jgi:nitrate/nitrite transporter NarK